MACYRCGGRGEVILTEAASGTADVPGFEFRHLQDTILFVGEDTCELSLAPWRRLSRCLG